MVACRHVQIGAGWQAEGVQLRVVGDTLDTFHATGVVFCICRENTVL